jgi:hypothetical protein
VGLSAATAGIPGDFRLLVTYEEELRQKYSFEVARRESGHVRKGAAQVGGQAVDHLGTPSFLDPPLEDIAADLPVEADQLAVDGQGGAEPAEPMRSLSWPKTSS